MDDIFVLDAEKGNIVLVDILLMEYFFTLPGMYKPYQQWDRLPMNWLAGFLNHQPSTVACKFLLTYLKEECFIFFGGWHL